MTGQPSAPMEESDGVSLASLLRGLLRRRGLVIGCALACGLVAGVIGVLRPPA